MLRTKPALVIGVGVVAAVLVIGLAIALSGSEDDTDATAVEQPDPGPDYEIEPGPRLDPEPQPVPVDGEVSVADPIDVSVSGNRVFEEGREENEPVPVDEDAVSAFVDSITALLDDHLDALQHGEPGRLAVDELDGEASALMLADDERWVDDARYAATVYVRGEPEWASVDVEVERNDGTVASATLAFLPGDEPSLLAAQSDVPTTDVSGSPAENDPTEDDDAEGPETDDDGGDT